MPNVYDAIRIISLNLDEIEFVQHHVWIDLKPNQTEHIKYAGAHTLCIQNRAASMLLCSIYTLFYRHPYIRIQHAHSYLHSPVCKASKTNKGWRHRISVLTWTLLSCTICNLLTRRAHLLSLSHSKMLFVSSCAHQTSLNCVCSGAATWTNSATVNQLVYHWIYTLWLISKLIVIIILFRYFSADTFPNRFHFTIKRRKKNWIATTNRQSPEWKIPHTNARRQTERWIKSETCTNKYSTEKQTNHSKLDKGTCNALKSTLCCVWFYLFYRKTIFLEIIATRNFQHFR